MKSSLPKIASQVSAVLLLLSVLPVWPFIYHTVLRYFVGITSVLMIVRTEELKKPRWVLVWIAVAILFNPIVPVYLQSQPQRVLNLLCALLFGLSSRIFRL